MTSGSQARFDMRILVVDDQASIRQLVRTTLRQLGYQRISEAEDGEHALQIARVERPDLVILDGVMPRLDGIGTLETLRKDADLADVRVIMLTGRADTEFVKKAVARGVNGFLVKPFTAGTLGARIVSAFTANNGPVARQA